MSTSQTNSSPQLSPVAAVTGAGSGIGRASAIALYQAGYRLVLIGRQAEPLQETVQLGKMAVERVLVQPADIGKPDLVVKVFAHIKEQWGRLDVLFNNAGRGARPVPIDELTYAEWQAVVDVNLTGLFLCSQQAFSMMKKQDPKGGRIINNGSISAYAPRPFSAPYTSTKHAVTGLTKALALDGRAHDIACGQIDIGNAATDMTQPMTKGVFQANGQTMIEPRMDVNIVANAVVNMARLPLDANILFMTVMATKMPFVGRG